MRAIVFATQKGGCGKSTLAACLAVAAQEAGERVSVCDMDPKKSLVRWAAKRKDGDLPVCAISSAKLPAALIDPSKM
jgi:chromosome partitioning protein